MNITQTQRNDQTRHLLIGLQTDLALDALVPLLEPVLQVTLQERDSSFWGGTYFKAGRAGSEEVYLFRNYDPQDDAPIYPQASTYPVLLRLDRSPHDPAALLPQIRAAGAGPCALVRG
jgi:hypothetical protein